MPVLPTTTIPQKPNRQMISTQKEPLFLFCLRDTHLRTCSAPLGRCIQGLSSAWVYQAFRTLQHSSTTVTVDPSLLSRTGKPRTCTPSVWRSHVGEHKTRLPAQPSTLPACGLFCYLTTRNLTFKFLLVDTRAFHVMYEISAALVFPSVFLCIRSGDIARRVNTCNVVFDSPWERKGRIRV
jgi:hypothetical protein